MKKVIVTTSWDDGHKFDLDVAKLLLKYGIKGTFYIAPHNKEFPEEELLSDNEILTIANDFEIGAHTLTHPLLPNDLSTSLYKTGVKLLSILKRNEYKAPHIANYYEAKTEILGSKTYLEKLLNKKIVCFCYPAGRHNIKIRKLVEESGYSFARTVDEYSFTFPKNPLASATSVHANRHYRDILRKIVFSRFNFKEFAYNFDWEHLAIKMFDHVRENGGVFHLWGHSWLIEQNNDWGKLERIIKHVSNRKNVKYLTNSQLIIA